LVIVTPAYENFEAAGKLLTKLRAGFGRALCVVAFDDGSVRQPVTADLIEAAGLTGVVLRLRRDVGHQRRSRSAWAMWRSISRTYANSPKRPRGYECH